MQFIPSIHPLVFIQLRVIRELEAILVKCYIIAIFSLPIGYSIKTSGDLKI